MVVNSKRLRNPIIIDVEASGFGVNSYPIEIGIAFDNGAKYCTLIKPAPNWTHWDVSAEAVHQVTRSTLEEHGKPVAEVAASLNEKLRDKTVYTDGWVVDKPWVSRLFEAAGVPMAFNISSLELILSEQQMFRWHDAKDAIQDALKLTRHRASNDAWLVRETYLNTR